MGLIHPAVSEICVPQSLDPICGKFDKFLAHGQAHMGQMGIWPWQCTPTGLDNSTELWMEKIHQAVTDIWVPQVWQPPAQPPARPPAPWRQYPSSPEGWGVKMHFKTWSAKWWPLCLVLNVLNNITKNNKWLMPDAEHTKYNTSVKVLRMISSQTKYRQISNTIRTKSQNLNVSRLVLHLSLPNLLKPCVKLRMKM